jgi:hypothetical protein
MWTVEVKGVAAVAAWATIFLVHLCWGGYERLASSGCDARRGLGISALGNDGGVRGGPGGAFRIRFRTPGAARILPPGWGLGCSGRGAVLAFTPQLSRRRSVAGALSMRRLDLDHGRCHALDRMTFPCPLLSVVWCRLLAGVGGADVVHGESEEDPLLVDHGASVVVPVGVLA